MRILAVLFPIFSLLFIRCSSPTQSHPPLELAKMEIHYSKTGGWTHTATLDIYSDGLVRAHRIGHASLDTLARVSTFLNLEDQRRIAALFTGFSSYDSLYEPDPWYTDGDYHNINFVYEGNADTVSVYEPEQVKIPGGLRKIIREMESLWQHLMFPLD